LNKGGLSTILVYELIPAWAGIKMSQEQTPLVTPSAKSDLGYNVGPAKACLLNQCF